MADAQSTPSRLTFVELVTTGSRATALYRCICGREKVIRVDGVKSGHTQSCGCLHREVARDLGLSHKTHGMVCSPEYKVWRSMLDRARGTHSFDRYGARGIGVCDRWLSFENFYADMGPRPSDKHSIDRIDNDGNYEPSNCRWATNSQQSRNRRTCRLLTHAGRTQCVADWADETGIASTTIHFRLQSGWSDERALTTPVRGK